MYAQLGFDWQQLINIGANVASNIGSAITGQPVIPTYGITGATGPGVYGGTTAVQTYYDPTTEPYYTPGTFPGGVTGATQSTYFWPVLIGGGLLLYFVLRENK